MQSRVRARKATIYLPLYVYVYVYVPVFHGHSLGLATTYLGSWSYVCTPYVLITCRKLDRVWRMVVDVDWSIEKDLK